MNIYYVYSLSIKTNVFYVGVSVNPALRLFQHIKADYCGLGKILNSVKDVSEISINILDRYKSKKNRVDQNLSQIEFYWINKYLIDGFKLKNKLIKNSSKIKAWTPITTPYNGKI